MSILAVSSEVARSAAVAAAVGFGLLVAFQIALAAGAPWGEASWGGAHAGRLPSKLRVASAASALVWIGAGLVLFARAGYGFPPLPSGLGRTVTWVLFGLLVLGALMNLASRSRWERFLMAPVAAVLAVLVLVVALGD